MSISFDPDGSFTALSESIPCEAFLKLGRAAAEIMCHGGRLLVGTDTRISSAVFEQALTAGILSAGCEAVSLGVIPQSAGAYLVKKTGADGGGEERRFPPRQRPACFCRQSERVFGEE